MAALIAPLLTLLVAATPPIQTGDVFAGWRVTGVDRHPEFRRYTLRRGAARTVVEVTYRHTRGSPWESRYYRVQPAPGQRAVLPVVRAMLARLKTLEARPGYRPMVRRYGTRGSLQNVWLKPWAWALGLAAALAIALLLIGLRRPLRRAWARLLRNSAPRLARPPPYDPPFGGDRTGNVLLAAALATLTAGGLLYFSAPAPLQSDTCLDLALARDCVDGAGCPRQGEGSSFRDYRHGAGWPTLLAGEMSLGLGATGFQVGMVLLHGLALGLFLWTLLPRLPRHLALCGAALFGAATLTWSEYPTLWNPVLLPVGTATLLAGLVGVLRTGRSRFGALALVGLAVSLEAHLMAVLLVPPTLFVLALADRRPAWMLGLGGAALLGLTWAVSAGSMTWNLVMLQRQGALAPLLAALGLPIGLGLALRAEHRHDEPIAVTVVGGITLVLLLAFAPLAWERRSSGTPLRGRYLLPLVPLAIYAVGQVLAALRRTPLRAWGITTAVVVMAGWAGWHTLRRVADPRAYWSLQDAEALASGPFARTSFEDLARRLRGPQHQDLLKCFVSLSPAPWRRADGPHKDTALYLARGDDPAVPASARRVPLGDGRSAALWSLRSWLKVPPALQPRPPGPARRSYRARVYRLVHSSPLHEQRIPIRIRGPDKARAIRVVPSASPWRIRAVKGVASRVLSPGRAVELRRGGGSAGVLVLGLATPDPWFDPPSLLETPTAKK